MYESIRSRLEEVFTCQACAHKPSAGQLQEGYACARSKALVSEERARLSQEEKKRLRTAEKVASNKRRRLERRQQGDWHGEIQD